MVQPDIVGSFTGDSGKYGIWNHQPDSSLGTMEIAEALAAGYFPIEESKFTFDDDTFKFNALEFNGVPQNTFVANALLEKMCKK